MGKSRDSANLVSDNNLSIDITNDRIGIGSTVPTSKLDVIGDGRFSGVVTSFGFSGNISGVAATFSGNVSVAGTLTFEDVTNVDSLGVITARNGVQITGGGGLNITGGAGIITASNVRPTNLNVSGLSTFTSTVELDGALRDITGQVGAARSTLISTGVGIAWTTPPSKFSAVSWVLS